MIKPEDRLLMGYWYRTKPMPNPPDGEPNIRLQTGMGGAQLLIKACRKEGMPEEMILDFVQVYIDGEWYSLSMVTVKKNFNE